MCISVIILKDESEIKINEREAMQESQKGQKDWWLVMVIMGSL